ncbi:MAG TPA: hypothetical protein VLT86_02220 [Vicinamibacterales bacterium]|nr:hypothetical protein [Vicinamibacterales bacterium]
MTRPPILTTRNIALAEAALRAVLTRTLVGTGLDFHRWVALKIAADQASSVPAAALVEQMRDCLKIDDAQVLGALDDLCALGLADRTNGRIYLTLAGRALHDRLCDETGVVAQRIYAGLDPDDLAATHRVLSTIAGRANALLAELS